VKVCRTAVVADLTEHLVLTGSLHHGPIMTQIRADA
jgi:hypothetical protein